MVVLREGQTATGCCLKNSTVTVTGLSKGTPTPERSACDVLVRPSVSGGIDPSPSNSAWNCKRKYGALKSSGVSGGEPCYACECSEH